MIDATVTVVDSGLFTEMACRIAREFTKVRSNVPWEAEFPTINDRAVGDGLSEVEWVEDALDPEIVDSTNLFVFPDIFSAGTQLLLEREGKLVWGSRHGDQLETRRLWFRKLQAELGLPTPEYTVIKGLTNLRAFLSDHGHCFVKTTSKIRGSMETWEHFGAEQSEYTLDHLAVKFGAFKELVVFLVEEPIETPFETGFDTHCIDGQCPKTPIQGIEIKGKLILCSAQTKSKTPDFIDEAMLALAPTLKAARYRNFLSAEFRKHILSDPCCRAPNPGIGCEMEMIRNIGEIMWKGAQGEMVEPDYEFEFGIQAAIFHDHEGDLWKQFRIPDDLRRWVKLMEFCKKGGCYQIIPRPPHGQKIGWLVGVGNTIQEAADHLQENAKAFKEYPFDVKLDALAEAVKQVAEAQEEGVEFTNKPLPEPGAVLEPT